MIIIINVIIINIIIIITNIIIILNSKVNMLVILYDTMFSEP